jgi:two-component system NtrC family sensor kinase
MTSKTFSRQEKYFLRRRTGSSSNAFRMFLLLGIGIYACGVADFLYYSTSPLADNIRDIAIAGLVAAVIVLLYLHLSYRKALGALHTGILTAQEGALDPVTIGTNGDDFIQRLVTDYNLLVNNLGSMFVEIEECQNRTIAERNRNDAILRSLPGALLCVDSDLRVTQLNRQAENLFGMPQEDLIDRSLFDVLDVEEEGVELLRDAFLYERRIDNKEVVLHLDGATRYFTLNLSLFSSSTPNEIGAAIILQDVTDYRRLQESMYNTEKLAAIGQLAAGVAHELNTPLGNILGYSQLLHDVRRDPDKLESYTGIISTEAKRCSRIIEDLLRYARRDHCRPETCEVNNVVRDVVETIMNCQGQRYDATIETALASGDMHVQAGTAQVEIMLVNLLMNAMQAGSGAGVRPLISLRTHTDSRGNGVVTVEDNGPGVPSGLQNRIFDPFFTTKGVGEGTGLGLAITQAMVAKLGGSLRCDASYKEGARFVLKLPLE